MAKMQVFTYENLLQYDPLIKSHVNTEITKAVADSIKTVTIDGSTIKFYTVPEPVGTTEPVYELTLPSTDISGLMTKLTGATTGNVVTVADNGEVADGGVALADLATKAEVEAVDDKADANATAIETINNVDTGILATAKTYTDVEVKKLADGAVATNTADIITMKSQIEALEAGTYDDTEVRGLISDNADAISDLDTEVGDLATLTTTEKASIVGAINELSDGKADIATTIAGYGITDAYTKTEVDSVITTAVANAEHLKRSIVDALPDVGDADTHTIYMVAIVGGDGNQKYEEFMLINDSFEKIGDSAVDLTDYATNDEVDTAKNEATTYADGLNTAMDTRVTAVEGLIGDGYEAIPEASITALFSA